MPTYSEVQAKILANLGTGSQITAEKHREVENDLLNFARDIAESQWLPGDVKEVDCNSQYITLHFEDDGMGKVGGPREGWAICNGNNLTKNRMGRVSVGFGTLGNTVYTMETNGSPNIGGAQTHALTVTEMPRHGHKFGPLFRDSNLADNNMPPRGSNATVKGYAQTAVTGGAGSGEFENTTTGTAVAHNNMQPYIVTLFIQKL
jgi:microcystin-dependent protein